MSRIAVWAKCMSMKQDTANGYIDWNNIVIYNGHMHRIKVLQVEVQLQIISEFNCST